MIQKIHAKYQTPINSVLLQGIWSCLLIVAFYYVSEHPKQVFDLMTDAVICAGLIFYSLAVGAVYILRIRNPHAARPYRTWGYPVTPALLIGSYLIALIATLRQQSDKLAWVLALIVAGIVFYYLKSSKMPKNPAESDQPTALS